jgi:type I restriction enzyme M protein
VETEGAWKVAAEEVKGRGYNLDIKNPHVATEEYENPEELLRRLDEAETETAQVAGRLKSILEEALLR